MATFDLIRSALAMGRSLEEVTHNVIYGDK